MINFKVTVSHFNDVLGVGRRVSLTLLAGNLDKLCEYTINVMWPTKEIIHNLLSISYLLSLNIAQYIGT